MCLMVDIPSYPRAYASYIPRKFFIEILRKQNRVARNNWKSWNYFCSFGFFGSNWTVNRTWNGTNHFDIVEYRETNMSTQWAMKNRKIGERETKKRYFVELVEWNAMAKFHSNTCAQCTMYTGDGNIFSDWSVWQFVLCDLVSVTAESAQTHVTN